MHSSGEYGCHKVPPPADKRSDVDVNGDVADEAPEMGVWLLARLRMHIVASHIVASLFGDEPDSGSPAVAA